MFELIERKVRNIRREPEHVRERYVWGGVLLAMSIIAFIWLVSMRVNFLNINADTQTRESLSDLHNRMDNLNTENKTQNPISIDELLESPSVQ